MKANRIAPRSVAARPGTIPRRTVLALAAALAGMTALPGRPAAAAERPVVTVGVLKFGTVNWELDTVTRNRLDEEAGITVRVVELAGNQATQIALQAESVDMIVSDWLWVSRQRSAGADLSFVPYSTSVGVLVVPASSPVASVGDLAGRRIGVAGTPLDKSWLLLKAYALRRHGLDLDKAAHPAFAAPPLLNEKLASGEFDAVLNFWPYAARLEAEGMRPVIGVERIIEELGIGPDVPALGYVFRQSWAEAHPAALAGFVAATRRAKELLAASDAEWQRLRPLMQVADDATWARLRDRYREGIPRRWGAAERDAAARLYALLAELGGPALVGDAPALAEGTFWPAADP